MENIIHEDNMAEPIKPAKSKIKIFGIVMGSIFLVLCLSVLTFFLVFHIKEVEVIGSTRYTADEIKDMALTGRFASNSMLVTWRKGEQEVNNIPFLNGFKIEMVDNHKIRIIVSEKQIIGYIKYQESDMFFDKDGLVVESIAPKIVDGKQVIAGEVVEDKTIKPQPLDEEDVTEFTAAVTNVPLIEGLNVGEAALNRNLKVEDPAIFNTIWGITRMVERFDIQPDKVAFDEVGNATMHYGNIRVLIGGNNLLEEKISRAAAILPKLAGKSGELHLEAYKEGVDSIIFSGDVAEEVSGEPVEGEEADGESSEDVNDSEEISPED